MDDLEGTEGTGWYLFSGPIGNSRPQILSTQPLHKRDRNDRRTGSTEGGDRSADWSDEVGGSLFSYCRFRVELHGFKVGGYLSSQKSRDKDTTLSLPTTRPKK